MYRLVCVTRLLSGMDLFPSNSGIFDDMLSLCREKRQGQSVRLVSFRLRDPPYVVGAAPELSLGILGEVLAYRIVIVEHDHRLVCALRLLGRVDDNYLQTLFNIQ